MKPSKHLKIVALTDVQGVRYDPKAWEVTMKFLKDFKPDITVINGDFTDLNMLSSYVEGIPGLWDNLKVEYDLCNKLLDEVQKLSKETVYVMGNHEERAYKYAEKFPFLSGTVEVDKALRLGERGVEFLRYNGIPLNIGPINFIHGEFVGKNHAQKTLDAYDMNVFYGHTHDVTSAAKSKYGKTIIAQSMGMLCKYDQDYVKQRPTNWQQSFGVFLIDGDDFCYEIPRISEDYTFWAQGRRYDLGTKNS